MNLYFLIASEFAASYLLTYLVINLSLKFMVLDYPNDRSSHLVPTPRGGGLAVVVVFYLTILSLSLYGKYLHSLLIIMISGLPIAIIGYIDDLYSIKPGIRFVIQSLSAVVALTIMGGISEFSVLNVHVTAIWIFSLAALIGIIWSINLFNFIDGIDGYLASEAIFLGISDFILTKEISGLIIAASVGGFLIWNWQKAKIFMGDIGSAFIGFVFAVIAIKQNNSKECSIIVWLILTSLFWFDATITLLRRCINHEVLKDAHRKHAYQRIVQAGFSHQKAVIYAMTLNILIFFLAMLAKKFPEYDLYFFIVDLIFLYIILKVVDRIKPFAIG